MKLFQSQVDFYQRMIDAVIVSGTLPLAFWLYYGHLNWNDKYIITAIAAIPIFYLSAKASNLYRPYFVQFGEQQIRSLLVAWFLTLAGLLLMGYAFKSTHELSRVTMGLYAIILPVFLLISRLAVWRFIRAIDERGYGVRSAIIIGTDDNARALAESIACSSSIGLRFKGFVELDDRRPAEALAQGQVLGKVSDIAQLLAGDDVDIVYISVPMSDTDTLSKILKVLGDSTVSIFLVPDLYTAEIMQGTWITLGDVPTVCVIDGPTQGINPILKRIEDLVISTVSLTLLAIPMLFIAIAVRLTSPGPALYKQVRYGISGKPIVVWKFRTMSVMETTEDFVQATKNDSRVTRLGGFLRRTSLDEVPQLFNVLMGDMSIVGPRPHPVALNEAYRDKIFGYMLRHKVKPGITGLAQVNGFRGETDTHDKMEHRIRYDIEYINSWSMWLDLAIIIRTPLSLLRSENAY